MLSFNPSAYSVKHACPEPDLDCAGAAGHNAANAIGRSVIKYDFEGKLALVGGASQGIGEATVRLLAECGAKVIMISRRSDVMENIRASLPQPQNHRTLAVDMERSNELSIAVGRLIGETGPVSIWVNNTGGPKAGPLLEASADEMERAYRGHVVASQIIMRTLLPGMKQLGFGRVINVLSTSVKVPIPNLGVSNVVRAAMANWAKTVSQEVGSFGITVNNVLPGFTETPRLNSLAQTAAGKAGVSEDQIRKDWMETIPLKRLATPQETAQVIAFLASEQANYISGVSLPVDGGRTGAI